MSGDISTDSPLFVVNTAGGRIKMDDIVAAFDEALKTVSPDERPNLNLWAKAPYLNMDQWRLFTNNDRNSAARKIGRTVLRSRILDLEMDFKDALPNIGCKPVEGVDKDFSRNSMPEADPLPGPFQNLKEGKNWFQLLGY